MAWDVEYTDEFGEWWNGLTDGEQKDIAVVVGLLTEHGVDLAFPYSSKISGSSFSSMRELRIQHKGEPYRILYAFDPRRFAILLLGGCKTGNNRWYEIHIPRADKLYHEHLHALAKEERK